MFNFFKILRGRASARLQIKEALGDLFFIEEVVEKLGFLYSMILQYQKKNTELKLWIQLIALSSVLFNCEPGLKIRL